MTTQKGGFEKWRAPTIQINSGSNGVPRQTAWFANGVPADQNGSQRAPNLPPPELPHQPAGSQTELLLT